MSHPHDDHNHSHTPVISHDNERKVLIAFFITFSFMIVEAVGGYLSGSLALIADAGHMLTDAVALALAYAAFRFGRRAADQHRTFGYMRFEVIAGFVNALTLFAIVIWIGYEAWHRLQSPPQILAGPMMAVAVTGLLVNIFVLWFITRGDTDHVNIKGAALHVLGDLLGSVGAIVAAIIIYTTGWTSIDPILSVLVSLLIVRSAWALLRKSLHILLEGAPDNVTPEKIEAHLMLQVPGLVSVSHIHVWLITSGRALATLHIRPINDSDARVVSRQVEQALKEKFAIEHATIAIDWNDESNPCSLSQTTPPEPHDHSQTTQGPHS